MLSTQSCRRVFHTALKTTASSLGLSLIAALLWPSLTSAAPGKLTARDLAARPAKVSEQSCPRQLDILLTNDDGFDSPGIRALFEVLTAAEHRVLLAAPSRNASGSGASLSFKPIAVSRIEDTIYAVDASPASTVLLALSNLYPEETGPDLLISGINKGANLGPATAISGTVGATIAAMLIQAPPLPAIAVSTDPLSEDLEAKQNLNHYREIAEFVAQLVTRLSERRCRSGEFLPTGIALNVNYPPLPRDQIKGVKLSKQGRAPYFKLSYQPQPDDPGLYLPVFRKIPLQGDRPGSDTLAYRRGYITMTPLDGNYSLPAAHRARTSLKDLSSVLSP